MPSSKVWILNREELPKWHRAACALAGAEEVAAVLLSNDYPKSLSWSAADSLIALGEYRVLNSNEQVFSNLQEFHSGQNLAAFGYLSYDLKNEVEDLVSANTDTLENSPSIFVEPISWIRFDKLQMRIESHDDPEEVYLRIKDNLDSNRTNTAYFQGTVQCRMSQEEYLAKVKEIRQLIGQGNVYEMNLCLEFFAENCWLDPFPAFEALMEKSPTPFAAYMRFHDLHILSASPERFLAHSNRRLLSQPIKGTRGRGQTHQEDLELQKELKNSEKDRAENVMIVDLVRNDLARSCKAGSVKVEELFGIYSFPQVHQMISTVSGELRDDTNGLEALKKAFPMGSMTGAPKVMAMKQIERLENSKRGVYSGALGVLEANGDYDFNVLIRTLVYRDDLKKLSFQAGGAITYDSVPQEEWEEILVKASAIKEILQ